MVLLAKRVRASAPASISTSVSSASESCRMRSARRRSSASDGRCASATAGLARLRRAPPEALARFRTGFACRAHDLAKRDAHANVAEARRRGAVAGAHGLHGLALAAIGRAPERPVVARADGVATIPELRGDAAVAGILEHAAFLAALDLPADLGGELKMVAAIVDGPGAVGLHQDAVVGVGDQVVVAPGAGQQADVGHADDRQAVPAFGAHGAAGARAGRWQRAVSRFER